MTRASIAALALIAWAAPAVADTYPRQPGVDAWHYVFRLELSDTSPDIIGEATVDLLFTKDGVSRVALDLASAANGKGMTVSEVTTGAARVQYVHQNNVLTLTLPSPSTCMNDSKVRSKPPPWK